MYLSLSKPEVNVVLIGLCSMLHIHYCTETLLKGLVHNFSQIIGKCMSPFPRVQDDIFRCLVLSSTKPKDI